MIFFQLNTTKYDDLQYQFNYGLNMISVFYNIFSIGILVFLGYKNVIFYLNAYLIIHLLLTLIVSSFPYSQKDIITIDPELYIELEEFLSNLHVAYKNQGYKLTTIPYIKFDNLYKKKMELTMKINQIKNKNLSQIEEQNQIKKGKYQLDLNYVDKEICKNTFVSDMSKYNDLEFFERSLNQLKTYQNLEYRTKEIQSSVIYDMFKCVFKYKLQYQNHKPNTIQKINQELQQITRLMEVNQYKCLTHTNLTYLVPSGNQYIQYLQSLISNSAYLEVFCMKNASEIFLPGNRALGNFLDKIQGLNYKFQEFRTYYTISDERYKKNPAFYDALDKMIQNLNQKIIYSTSSYSTFSNFINIIKDEQIQILFNNYLEDQLALIDHSIDYIDSNNISLTDGFIGSSADLNHIIRTIIAYYYANKKEKNFWHTLFIGNKGQLCALLYGLSCISKSYIKKIGMSEKSDYITQQVTKTRMNKIIQSVANLHNENYDLMGSMLKWVKFFNNFLSIFIETLSPSGSNKMAFYVLRTDNLQRHFSHVDDNIDKIVKSYSIMEPIDTIVSYDQNICNIIIGYSASSIEDPAISSRFQNTIICNEINIKDFLIYFRRTIIQFCRINGLFILKDVSIDKIIFFLTNRLSHKYEYLYSYLITIFNFHKFKSLKFEQLLKLL